LTKIIFINGRFQYEHLEKELVKSRIARPIAIEGTRTLFLMLEKLFQQYEFPACSLHDLFYCGCVFLGMLFGKAPEHTWHEKHSRQVIEPLRMGANTGMQFDSEWIKQAFYSSYFNCDLPAIANKEMNAMKCRMIETMTLIKNLNLNKAQLVPAAENRAEKEILFHSIEFLIRKGMEQLIKDQIIRLDRVLQRNSIIFMLVDNVSRIGSLASIAARLLQEPVEEFMQLGVTKFLKMIE